MSAIQVIYSPVNQGYLIMWFCHVLAVRIKLSEVNDYLVFLNGR